MENATIEVITKRVGNSIALFIPAEICEALQIKANTKIIAHLHKKKKKDVKELLSLFGALKGKNITWDCREDRLNAWGE
ncbi:hypothetical protein KKF81_06885 [Candidatus Micrarchaeota archaeon]|nr:hypothetical protein [Candidatus Micrarchaeota archaeon]MBU1166655.1 hypothetical protein [Candidatus Micrarchaeota archaeon]MBU1886612.1 hypothetical protein [Candidatus Micrarchaeota archaeon]